MFGKKILSLITTLFVASRFVKATDLPACGRSTCDSETVNSLCVLSGDKKIYKAASSCYYSDGDLTDAITADGIYVFDNVGSTNPTAVTIGSSGGDPAANAAQSWTIYQCKVPTPGTVKCTQTYGYLKVGTTNTCTVSAEGASESGCTSSITNDCSDASHVGSMTSTTTLCVEENATVASSIKATIGTDDGKSFLLTDKQKVFSGANTNTVVVAAYAAGVVLDTAKDGTDYCVDDNKAVYERIPGGLCDATIASGEDCTSYYSCGTPIDKAVGVCSVSNANPDPSPRQNSCNPTTGTQKCDEGYYLVANGNAALETDPAKDNAVLYQCYGTAENNAVCKNLYAENTGNGAAPLGYLANAGNLSSTPYIVCTSAKTCKIAKINDDCVAEASNGHAGYGELFGTPTLGNVQLCLYGETPADLTISEAGKYIIKKKAAMFGIDNNSNSILLEVDSDRNLLVSVDSGNVGYYGTPENSIIPVTVPGAVDTLFKCESATGHIECTSKKAGDLLGYVKNKASGTANYIECDVSELKAINADTGATCDATNNGQLISSGDGLCIYDTEDKKVTFSGAAQYFVKAFTDTNQSLLGLPSAASTHAVVFSVDTDGNVLINNDRVRYRYTNGGNEHLIYSRAAAQATKSNGELPNTAICKTSGTPFEYVLDEWNSNTEISSNSKAKFYVTKTQYDYLKNN